MSSSSFSRTLKRSIQMVVGLALAATLAPTAAEAQALACRACQDCLINGVVGHRTFGRAPNAGEYGLFDSVHGCLPEGPCSNPDDSAICQFPATAMTDLEAAAQDGNLTRLAEIVQTSEGRVELNTRRSALQVVGCTGAIIAHIPLNGAQLASLRATLSAPVQVGVRTTDREAIEPARRVPPRAAVSRGALAAL